MELRGRRILVTGANGFIGKNLVVRLREFSDIIIKTFVRGDDLARLPKLMSQVDVVVHLAGENRPSDNAFFAKVNAELTYELCNAIREEARVTGRLIQVIFASTAQVDFDNPYGRSKRAGEAAIEALSKETGNACVSFRLPGVFGKWCRPNYNSVVATFCHNIARDLPIMVHDPSTRIRLVYVDNVIDAFLSCVHAPLPGYLQGKVEPEFSITLGELEQQIRAFAGCREGLVIEKVGVGFVRALYATYLSHLPKEKFSYAVPQYVDSRGVFVEMLKTRDSGQFSYFKAYPGVTRGGHYHHSKNEKFLVVKGEALFRFRHLLTQDYFELRAGGHNPCVVDSIPGWTHDITNVGDDELVVMLWANENFDREKPDTVASEI
jgi:UDP-2-acetamido-2,6-beta-L-arabino-hexul-4-ose reductase